MTITAERAGTGQAAAAATVPHRLRQDVLRESGLLRCKCGNVMGSTAGRYTLMRWRQRSYLLIDVRHALCEVCGHSFTPDRCTIQAPMNVAALKVNTEVLRCKTPGCGGMPLCNVREGTAIVDAAGRVVVASALAYTDCWKCGKGIDLGGPVALLFGSSGGSGTLPPNLPPSPLSLLAAGNLTTSEGALVQ